MRRSLLLAFLAAPLLPIASISFAQNASDWMDPPKSTNDFPLTDAPSLQTPTEQDRTDLTSLDGWFGSPSRPANQTNNLNPMISRPVGPIPHPGQNKVRSLPVAQGASTNPWPNPSAQPAPLAPSLVQATRQHPTNVNSSASIPVATHPIQTAYAPFAAPHPQASSCGCGSSMPNAFDNFGLAPRSSTLSNYMQCNPCNSGCLWAGYACEHEKLWARKLRHVNGSCGCFSDTQYFGNVLASRCKNRYTQNCGTDSPCQQGCDSPSCDGGCASTSNPGDGFVPPASPIPQAEATAINPQGRNAGPSIRHSNPAPAQRSALPNSGRVATQPSPGRSPY